ncbi:MAG: cephalosporin hydroxylase family protein [Polyangiaceae bacterium]
MKIAIDTDAKRIDVDDGGTVRQVHLYSSEGFALLSRVWTNVGWDQKYPYGFTWLGRPIIQLPEDIVRIQETIYRVQPDVVVETGVAHGGSLIFYAGLFAAMGKGRVVGVDIEIRPHNRKAVESHRLAPFITMIEGSSTSPPVVEQVRALIRDGERVLVILDSNHTKDHVAAELLAYAPMVSVDSYIVATDGIMEDLSDVPRGKPAWKEDNPAAAAREFATSHPTFVQEPPPFVFDETLSRVQVTHWPSAYLRRVQA